MIKYWLALWTWPDLSPLTAHITLSPVSVQKQTCVSGSCSGATVEFTSVKSSLLMIWRGRMRPSWSYWCSVWQHFLFFIKVQWHTESVHDQLGKVFFKCLSLVKFLSYAGEGLRSGPFVAMRSKVSLQRFPWRRPDGSCLLTWFNQQLFWVEQWWKKYFWIKVATLQCKYYLLVKVKILHSKAKVVKVLVVLASKYSLLKAPKV